MAQKELIKKYIIIVAVIIGIFALIAGAAFIVHTAVSNLTSNSPIPTASPLPGFPSNSNEGQNNGNEPLETAAPTPMPTPGITLPGLTAPDRVTILLLGVDEHNNTDANLIMTLDTQSRMINVISIPRDMRVTLPASDVNELRALGRTSVPANGVMRFGNLYAHAGRQHGPRFAVRHLSAIFGIEIDNFVVLELSAFRNIVDLVGGVEFNVPRRMYYNPPDEDFVIDLQPGMQRLDGRQAEALVRYRYSLARADLDRIDIQQDFMRAMFTQALNAQTIRDNFRAFTQTILSATSATDVTITNALNLLPTIEALTSGSIRFHVLPGTEAAGGFFNYDHVEGRTFFDDIFDR